MKRMLALALPIALLAMAAPASAKTISFTFVNTTDTPVTEFYIAAPNVDNWEDNLVVTPVPGGGKAPVNVSGGDICVYDIHAVFEDGSETDDRGVDLCETDEYSVTE
jgi:hypothetical protein